MALLSAHLFRQINPAVHSSIKIASLIKIKITFGIESNYFNQLFTGRSVLPEKIEEFGTLEDIEKWEAETAQALRTILDDEHAGLFLHEPMVPVQMSGYQHNIMHLAGRVQARMKVLNQIIKEFSE